LPGDWLHLGMAMGLLLVAPSALEQSDPSPEPEMA